MARALASGGMEDFIIISRESAAAVFTPKRQEIVDHLRRESPGSVRELARQLERDKGQVSRDLTTLAEHGILTYEDQGRARRPVLTDEHIIVEPV